jgi:hypothetical protein
MVAHLEKLAYYYRTLGNKSTYTRANIFAQAANLVRRCETTLDTEQKITQFGNSTDGIGPATMREMIHVLTGKESARLSALESDKRLQTLVQVPKTLNVGERRARELYNLGVRKNVLEDLKTDMKKPEGLAIGGAIRGYVGDIDRDAHVDIAVSASAVVLTVTGTRKGRGFIPRLCQYLMKEIKTPLLVCDLPITKRSHWDYTGVCRLQEAHLEKIDQTEGDMRDLLDEPQSSLLSGRRRRVDIHVFHVTLYEKESQDTEELSP